MRRKGGNMFSLMPWVNNTNYVLSFIGLILTVRRFKGSKVTKDLRLLKNNAKMRYTSNLVRRYSTVSWQTFNGLVSYASWITINVWVHTYFKHDAVQTSFRTEFVNLIIFFEVLCYIFAEKVNWYIFFFKNKNFGILAFSSKTQKPKVSQRRWMML